MRSTILSYKGESAIVRWEVLRQREVYEYSYITFPYIRSFQIETTERSDQLTLSRFLLDISSSVGITVNFDLD